MTWEQTVVGLVRLAVDPEAGPRDLLPVHQDPLRHQDPVRAKRGAEEVRKALANTREDTP